MQFLSFSAAILAALTNSATALPAQQGPSSAGSASTTTASAPSRPQHIDSFFLPPLPTDLAPGIYSFNHDAFGRPNHTRIADVNTTAHAHHFPAEPSNLDKRETINNKLTCEDYSLTNYEQSTLNDAYSSLFNWAASSGDGYSPWITANHYYARSDNGGAVAYLCQWGSGNHAGTNEVNTAQAVVDQNCAGKAGMYQWNEWKKGIGAAAVGQNWCNGQSWY